MADVADVSMDYDSMSSLVTAVDKMNSDFSDLEKKLKQLSDNLDGEWEGDAHTEFCVAYDKILPKLKSINKMLETFAKAVDQVAADQQTLDSTSSVSKSNLSF